MKRLVLFCISLMLIVSMTSCYQHVPVRTVGIKVKTAGNNKGVQPVTLPVGRYWIGAFWTLYDYPTNTHIYPFTAGSEEGSEVDEAMKFQDKDGLDLSVDVAISAHVNPELVTVTFQTYGGEMENIIKSFVRQDLVSSFIEFSSKYSAEELYSTRKMEMLEFVKRKVTDKYAPTGVIINDVVYKSQIVLPPKIKAAIDDKIEAGQTAMKTETQLQTSVAEAKKVAAQAEGEYQAKLLEAKGNIALSNSITPALTSYILANKWNGVSPIYSGNGAVLPPLFK